MARKVSSEPPLPKKHFSPKTKIHDFSKRNTSAQNFKNDILTINQSQRQLSPKEVIIKSNQLFSTKNNNSEKRIIYISDFQSKSEFPEVPDGITLDIVALKYQEVSNINIDTDDENNNDAENPNEIEMTWGKFNTIVDALQQKG